MKLFQLLPEKIVHLTCNWPGGNPLDCLPLKPEEPDLLPFGGVFNPEELV